MNVLVVGSGAREHALAWKLSHSPSVERVYCLPGNAGTTTFAHNLQGRADDIKAVVQAARERAVDLVVIGPEDPLVRGLVDALRDVGIAAFGPDRAAAQLEG